MLVETKLLSRQTCIGHNKRFLQQKFCHDKHTFVTTKDVFCDDKHDKTIVATKMILVAAPASDILHVYSHCSAFIQLGCLTTELTSL